MSGSVSRSRSRGRDRSGGRSSSSPKRNRRGASGESSRSPTPLRRSNDSDQEERFKQKKYEGKADSERREDTSEKNRDGDSSKRRSRSRSRHRRRSEGSDKDRPRTRSKTGSPADRKTRSRTGSPRSRSSPRDYRWRERVSSPVGGRRRSSDRGGGSSGSDRRGASNRNRSPVDEDGYRIHVADLDVAASKRDLEKIFGKFGPLKEIWMARSVPCFAFVVYRYKEDAGDAVRLADGVELCNRRIRVTHARPRTKGRGRRGFDPNMRCYQCGDRGHFSRDCPDTKYGYKRPPSPRYGRRDDRHYERSGGYDRYDHRRSRY